ncbi:MAG: hypothetical protein ABFD76_05090 [Smithella sp.]
MQMKKDKIAVIVGPDIRPSKMLLELLQSRADAELASLLDPAAAVPVSNATMSGSYNTTLTQNEIMTSKAILENINAHFTEKVINPMMGAMTNFIIHQSCLAPLAFPISMIENPYLVRKEKKQIRFPRSKKKRIRKKFFKRWMRTFMVPDDDVFFIKDTLVAHPETVRMMKEALKKIDGE